jgi:antitoxin ParD1/3/4
MEIALNSKHRKLIEQKIESGNYKSPDEVIEKALSLLDKYDEKLEGLRRDVQVGLDQLERGEYRDYTTETLHELFEEVEVEGRKRLEAKLQRNFNDSV